MARLQYSANTPENKTGLDDFTPIPAGDVIAQITKSEYKKTKKGDGNYLQLIWKIVTGEHKGRTIFDNLNLDNPNPIAIEIANKALNSICQAAKKVGVQDSEELHGIPIKLTLTVQAATATQPAGNNIRGYSEASLADVAVPEGAPESDVAQTASAPTANKTAKLPWE